LPHNAIIPQKGFRARHSGGNAALADSSGFYGRERAAEAAAGPSGDIEVVRILSGLRPELSFRGAEGPGIWHVFGVGD
jgi:hypothetical protein